MEFTLEKIPLKYILGTYVNDAEYPSPSDILYLMTRRASDKGKSLDPVTFTTTVLLKKIGQDKEANMLKSIAELENKGVVENNGETKTGISFKILKNPFL
mgnify:CR=1 FL=1|tara:strand:+ start:7371 stop:7670 length:300 start_codon:yes stop_codon:yes gene_type:complete